MLKSLRSWCHWKRNVRNSGFRHLFHQNRSMQTRDMANCDFKMLSKCERDAPAEIDVTSRHSFDLFGVTSACLQGAFTGQQWLSINFIGKSCAKTQNLVLRNERLFQQITFARLFSCQFLIIPGRFWTDPCPNQGGDEGQTKS